MPNIFFSPQADTYVSQFYPTKNFNKSPSLFVSRFRNTGDVYRSLIRFCLTTPDCSSDHIPGGATINEAYLRLTIARNEIPLGKTIYLNAYHLLQPWDAGKVTWKKQPLFGANPDVSVIIASGLGTVDLNLTSVVRGWFDGSIPNVGLLLTGDEVNNRLVGLYSSYFSNIGFWPRLYINFK
ncbi:MAG: DNRLRE domain-containing protein [Syntrophomonas sp.]